MDGEDVLLDIGCGNGALSRYLFKECREFFGVDFSEYLVSVAKENFESRPHYIFRHQDAAAYVDWEPEPARFTKALCYGCFMYLSFSEAEHVLRQLAERFTNLDTLYIGNIPDKLRAANFYPQDKDFTDLLADNKSPIGIWRSEEDIRELAEKTGWNVEFSYMDEDFYAAHYRFDAMLTRPDL